MACPETLLPSHQTVHPCCPDFLSPPCLLPHLFSEPSWSPLAALSSVCRTSDARTQPSDAETLDCPGYRSPAYRSSYPWYGAYSHHTNKHYPAYVTYVRLCSPVGGTSYKLLRIRPHPLRFLLILYHLSHQYLCTFYRQTYISSS